jgi:hypothetical protein
MRGAARPSAQITLDAREMVNLLTTLASARRVHQSPRAENRMRSPQQFATVRYGQLNWLIPRREMSDP